jgi:hypothetical protein
MATPIPDRVAVVLVGLDGLTVSLLRQALAGDGSLAVVHLPDDAPLDALAHERRTIVLVGATAAQLRRATRLVPRPDQLLATIAMFVEPPGSDVYFVSPAGRNVTSPDLAQLLHELVAADARGPAPSTASFENSPGASHEHAL